jgi:hypothetical protein
MTPYQKHQYLLLTFKVLLAHISLRGEWANRVEGFNFVHSMDGMRMGQPVVKDPILSLIAEKMIVVKTAQDSNSTSEPPTEDVKQLRALWADLEKAATDCGIKEAPHGYGMFNGGVHALTGPSDLATRELAA